MKKRNWKTVALVFVLSVLTEAAYTGYTTFVSRGNTGLAPVFAGLIAIGKGTLVYIYSRDWVQIGILAVGQVIGTYLMMLLCNPL